MGLRLRLFKQIPYLWALVFATALAAVQIFEHTDLMFVICCFVYILLATAAFNIADGLTSLPGIFIFATAVLCCVLGITTKALIGEPGQSNLKDGVATMEIYVLGMLALVAAAMVERRFRPAKPFIATQLAIRNMDAAFFGCALLGVAADTYYTFARVGPGGSFSAMFSQLNQFTSFAIILGTMQAVRKSQGRRNISALLLFLILFSTARGLLTFSKEAIFTPAVAWFVGMILAKYRIKIIDLAIFAVVLFVMVRIAVPFSQWGRNSRTEDAAPIENIPISLYLLQNLDVVDKGYADSKTEVDGWRYFSKDLGQMERLTMFPPDDDLIHYTNSGHLFGFEPTVEEIENLVPHFIWKNKPTPYFGNVYWHELGRGGEDDTTGISFSMCADAYHQGGLPGVLLLEPALLCFAFLLWSFALGGTQQHPANLIVALRIAHSAPEHGTNSAIGQFTNVVSVLLVAFLCRYVFPAIGSIIQRKATGKATRFTRQEAAPNTVRG